MNESIRKSALIVSDGQGKILMLRERGKPYSAFPGGKIGQDESTAEALHREIREELSVDATNVTSLGEVTGETPDGRGLTIYLFLGNLLSEPAISSEIEEMVWVDGNDILSDEVKFTPITRGACLELLHGAGVL